MSLINDALKRARQVPKRPAFAPGAEGILAELPPLHPVEDTDREKSQRLLVMIPVLLLSLGASFWFLWKWKTSTGQLPAADVQARLSEVQPSSGAKTNVLAAAAATLSKWQSRQQPEATEPDARASTLLKLPKAEHQAEGALPTSSEMIPGNSPSRPVETDSAPPVSRVTGVSPQPGSPPPAPEQQRIPKLQGIFYRLKQPTALLDGRIVSPGDEINGYRVARIERDKVSLVAGGKTKTLSLH